MLRIGTDTPGDVVARRAAGGSSVFLLRRFEGYFPSELFSTYSDFVAQPGQILKDETRTRITRISLASSATGAPRRDFAVKFYRYIGMAQFRSWYRQSKAHAEFCALCHLLHLNIPAVTPVACGLRRSRVGSVESCFLITDFADGFVSERDWLRMHPAPSPLEARSLSELAQALGQTVRRMHAQRLFVSRLSAKNLLVRFAPAGSIDWLFIDQPFAGFHRIGVDARFRQSYDLGQLKDSLERYRQVPFFEEFLQAYLPDPLGRSEAALRKGIAYGVDIRHDRTPFLRAIKGIKSVFQSKAPATHENECRRETR